MNRTTKVTRAVKNKKKESRFATFQEKDGFFVGRKILPLISCRAYWKMHFGSIKRMLKNTYEEIVTLNLKFIKLLLKRIFLINKRTKMEIKKFV